MASATEVPGVVWCPPMPGGEVVPAPGGFLVSTGLAVAPTGSALDVVTEPGDPGSTGEVVLGGTVDDGEGFSPPEELEVGVTGGGGLAASPASISS